MSDEKDGGQGRPNVQEVQFDRNELAASLSKLERELPALLQAMRSVAQMKRAFYIALIESGFNERQALDLTKDYPK